MPLPTKHTLNVKDPNSLEEHKFADLKETRIQFMLTEVVITQEKEVRRSSHPRPFILPT